MLKKCFQMIEIISLLEASIFYEKKNILKYVDVSSTKSEKNLSFLLLSSYIWYEIGFETTFKIEPNSFSVALNCWNVYFIFVYDIEQRHQ